MYIYINEKENIYPRFPGDIQLIDPTWNIGDPLPENWELVEDTPWPDYEVGQKVEELSPERIDGVWHRKWLVRDLTEAELEEIRLTQEKLIAEINGTEEQA